MANLGGTFDPRSVPAGDNNFETFPAGWYEMQIVGSEIRDTKAGDGKYIVFQWEVLGPSHANRRVFVNVNIQNRSDKAQEIGQRQLANICEATGVGAVEDTEELHYKPCLGMVSIEPAKDGYDAKNTIKRWKAIGVGEDAAVRPRQATNATSAARPTAQSAQAAPAAAAGGGRPWAAKR